MMALNFHVGQSVRCLIQMESDLREDGLGVEICATKGQIVIVRSFTKSGRIAVSHAHITDRSFTVSADEIEAVPPPLNGEVNLWSA